MADAQAWGVCGEIRAGSSPVIRTKKMWDHRSHFFCANNWGASTSHQCFFKHCTWTCIRRLPMQASTLRNILAFARIDKSSYPHQTKQIRTVRRGFFCLVFFTFNSSFFTFHNFGFVLKWKTKSEKLKAFL